MAKPVIGCDIGGVLKNRQDSSVIENSIKTLKELARDYEIIIISKCSEPRRLKSEAWIKEQGLDEFKILYCLERGDKVHLAAQNNVRVMIDDRLQVLSKFGDDVVKIWFCTDEKKIAGTKKHQPDLFGRLKLVTHWDLITDVIKENI